MSIVKSVADAKMKTPRPEGEAVIERKSPGLTLPTVARAIIRPWLI